MNPNVFIGNMNNVNWKKNGADDQDEDEELEETPVDVIKILGFDPKKESDE